MEIKTVWMESLTAVLRNNTEVITALNEIMDLSMLSPTPQVRGGWGYIGDQ